MTPEEQVIVDRHRALAKAGWRDPKMEDYDKDGYIPIGVALQMCICDLCQKYMSEKYPVRLPKRGES